MNTVRIAMDLPKNLLGALDVPKAQLEFRVLELIALELFREGRISSGKGAELLKISKLEFIRLLDRYGIAYFTESPEELSSDVETLEDLLNRDD